MAEKTGLTAALDALRPATELTPMKRAEQLSLLPSPAAEADAAADDQAAQRAGPGRPAGSKNRRTVEWQDFLLSRYRSPLVGLAEIAARPVEDLARELGCDRLEAFKLQLAAMKELAPYIHQKMPVALDAGENGLFHLSVNIPAEMATAMGVGEGDGVTLTLPMENPEKSEG